MLSQPVLLLIIGVDIQPIDLVCCVKILCDNGPKMKTKKVNSRLNRQNPNLITDS